MGVGHLNLATGSLHRRLDSLSLVHRSPPLRPDYARTVLLQHAFILFLHSLLLQFPPQGPLELPPLLQTFCIRR